MAGKKPEQPGKSHGARDAGGTQVPDGLDERRRRLAAELAARRGRESGSAGEQSARPSGVAQALKLSSEFVAGIIVGAAFGWVFDRLLGTSPWGLIVFLLLGFGAGVLNVLRSAGLASEGFGSGQTTVRDDEENRPEGPER